MIVLLFLIFLFIILCILIFILINNDMFMFLPVRHDLESDNIEIYNDPDSRKVVLFFPGNSSKIYENYYLKFKEMNINIFIINYRKKYHRTGNYFHVMKNARAAYQKAIHEFEDIIVCNYSIGNGVFADLLPIIHENGWKYPVLIKMFSGITNVKDVLYSHFSFFSYFFSWTLGKKLSTEEMYFNYLPPDVQLYIIHGTMDKIVPFKLVEKMHNRLLNAGKNVHLETFQGGHSLDIVGLVQKEYNF